MKNRILHIAICLMLILGCVSPRNILNPTNDIELREISDKIIYKDISDEYCTNIVFDGAFKGFQCYPEIDNSRESNQEMNFDDYKSFECVCYDYKLRTDQGSDLYIGIENGLYLHTKICYNSNKEIINEPEIENFKKCIKTAKDEHIKLSDIYSITQNEIKVKSNFGKWPALVYKIDEELLIWKVKRYYGKLNVTVHEFEIDAITGEILENKVLPYKRSFWQWIGKTEM